MLSLQQAASGHQWGEETGKAGQAKLRKEAESITEWKRGDGSGAALEASFSIGLGCSPSAAGKILSFSPHFVLDNLEWYQYTNRPVSPFCSLGFYPRFKSRKPQAGMGLFFPPEGARCD
jgi:hypothetical protein